MLGSGRDLPQGRLNDFEPWVNKGGKDQWGNLIGRTEDGMNAKLHAVTHANGRPILFFMTAGPVSEYTGAAALLGGLRNATLWIDDADFRSDLTVHHAA